MTKVLIVDLSTQLCYNVDMDNIIHNTPKSTSIRVWLESRNLLRLIAALDNTSMPAAIDKLARKEYERLQREHENETESSGRNGKC